MPQPGYSQKLSPMQQQLETQDETLMAIASAGGFLVPGETELYSYLLFSANLLPSNPDLTHLMVSEVTIS